MDTTRALAVPEILTLILQDLDMHTLLVSAQRVCHLWRSVIKETPSLQVKLFLSPSGSKESNAAPTFNPMLATKFPTFIPRNDRSKHQPTEFVDLTIVDFVLEREKQSAYLRPEASWRHMLTQQPPAFTLASITRSVNSEGVKLERSKGPRQDEGLRMGTLFEWVLSLPGHFFTSGVAIFFGGPSPVNVNNPFFNSGGSWAYWYIDIVDKHDIVLSTDTGSVSQTDVENGEGLHSEDALTRDMLFSAYQEAGLFTSGLNFENYELSM